MQPHRNTKTDLRLTYGDLSDLCNLVLDRLELDMTDKEWRTFLRLSNKLNDAIKTLNHKEPS